MRAMLFEIGFSTNTCLPAASASAVILACEKSGVPIEHRVDVVPVEHPAIVADDGERLGERAIVLEACCSGLR